MSQGDIENYLIGEGWKSIKEISKAIKIETRSTSENLRKLFNRGVVIREEWNMDTISRHKFYVYKLKKMGDKNDH